MKNSINCFVSFLIQVRVVCSIINSKGLKINHNVIKKNKTYRRIKISGVFIITNYNLFILASLRVKNDSSVVTESDKISPIRFPLYKLVLKYIIHLLSKFIEHYYQIFYREQSDSILVDIKKNSKKGVLKLYLY